MMCCRWWYSKNINSVSNDEITSEIIGDGIKSDAPNSQHFVSETNIDEPLSQ